MRCSMQCGMRCSVRCGVVCRVVQYAGRGGVARGLVQYVLWCRIWNSGSCAWGDGMSVRGVWGGVRGAHYSRGTRGTCSVRVVYL